MLKIWSSTVQLENSKKNNQPKFPISLVVVEYSLVLKLKELVVHTPHYHYSAHSYTIQDGVFGGAPMLFPQDASPGYISISAVFTSGLYGPGTRVAKS